MTNINEYKEQVLLVIEHKQVPKNSISKGLVYSTCLLNTSLEVIDNTEEA